MASRTEKFAYRVELDGKSAADALDILGKKSKDLREQMKKMKEANDLAGFEKVERELRSVEREAKRYQQAMFDVQKVMNNLSGVTTRDLITTQRILTKQLKEELIPGTKEYEAALKQLADVQKQVKANNAAIRNAGNEDKGSSMFGKLAEGVNKYALVVGSAIFGISSLVNKTSEAVEAFNKFEQAKAELQSLTGVSMQARDEMGKFALELSTSTVEGGVRITKSATDIVDAFKLVGSQAPELLKDSDALQQVTKDALILAEAAGGDVRENVKGLTTTMNMFDLVSSDTNKTIAESHRIINILAAGAQAGAGEIPYIQEAMEKAGTQAHMFGISVENTVGIIETLAPRISEASIAGTGLRGVLLDLEKQTNSSFKPSVVGYKQAMENLAAANLTAAQLIKLVGNEQATALTIMIKHRDETEAYTKAVTDTNKAVEQASINTNTNTAKLAQAANATEKLRIELGEKLAPAMIALYGATNAVLKGLASFFSLFDSKNDKITKHSEEVLKSADAYAENAKQAANTSAHLFELKGTIENLEGVQNKTKDQQDKLNSALAEVAKIVPGAITQWDAYGRALKLNGGAIDEYIQKQKNILQYDNREVIANLKKEIEEQQKIVNDAEFKLNKGKAIYHPGKGISFKPLTDEEYKKFVVQADGAQAILQKLKDSLDSKTGADFEKIIKAQTEAAKAAAAVAEAERKAKEEAERKRIAAEKLKQQQELSAEALKKAMEEVKDAEARIKQINIQVEASLKEGIEKEVYQIYQKYQKEIELAEKNENETTEIGKKWGIIKTQLKIAQAQEVQAVMQKFDAESEARQKKAIEKANQDLDEINNKFTASLTGSYEDRYNELVDFLAKGRISYEDYIRYMQHLDDEQAKRRAHQQDKETKQTGKATEKDKKEKIEQAQVAINSAMQITYELSNLSRISEQEELQRAGNNEEKKKQIRKKYADIELKITTAEIIATTALKVIQAFPNPFLMGAAAVAGAIQEVNAIKQRNLVAGYEQGYYNVTRTDGMQYRAGVSNDTSTQMVSKPTVFLAGEGGFPEMIIDGATMRNLQINYPEAINAIHASRSMPGFANGSYATNTVVNNNTVKEVVNAELINVLHDFKAMMAQGIRAKLVWRDLKEFEKKVDSLKTDFN